MTQYTKRQVADRIFMSVVVLMTALMPYIEAHDLLYALSHPDVFRLIAHAGLVAVSLLLLADTVVNDTFSDKYSLKIARKLRQLGWMLLGVGLTSLAFVNFRYYKDYSQAAWSFLFGVRCISIAFLDLRYEMARLQEEYTKCAMPSARSTPSF